MSDPSDVSHVPIHKDVSSISMARDEDLTLVSCDEI